MPTISFTITADHATRLTDALCGLYNYQEMIDNPSFDSDMAESKDNPRQIPNTETRADFARRFLREWMVQQVKRWEELQAKKAAETSISSISIL